MNVYDFDGTIYDGDSTVDFYRFAVRTNPLLIRHLPKQLLGFLKYAMKKIDKTEMKECFFCFLSGIDTDRLVEQFWNTHQNKIYDWYFAQQEETDIIISASPEFLLQPICNKLGVQYLIASKVDNSNGKFLRKNCRGKEKVVRLYEELGINHVDQFYSDSMSDLPMAEIADKTFMIKNGVITAWNI